MKPYLLALLIATSSLSMHDIHAAPNPKPSRTQESGFTVAIDNVSGQAGTIGPTGPTGPAGSFSSAYGQLNISSSHSINFSTVNQYVAIPFNAFSPFSNMMGSISSPATITIVEAGTYQMNISLYFSSEDSPEDTFNQATYTVGININSGTTTACAAVYAGEAGFFSINYSTITDFSPGDTIQFYMKASALGEGSAFENIVTLVSGNATLIQIAD